MALKEFILTQLQINAIVIIICFLSGGCVLPACVFVNTLVQSNIVAFSMLCLKAAVVEKCPHQNDIGLITKE